MTNKEKIKWQKAQLYDHPNIHPCVRGKQVWVKIGPPREVTGVTWLRELATMNGYEVNIEPLPGSPDSYIAYESVQDLLHEFAEEVEIIPYSVWSTAEVSSPAFEERQRRAILLTL